jgi:hypothetical protein
MVSISATAHEVQTLRNETAHLKYCTRTVLHTAFISITRMICSLSPLRVRQTNPYPICPDNVNRCDNTFYRCIQNNRTSKILGRFLIQQETLDMVPCSPKEVPRRFGGT